MLSFRNLVRYRSSVSCRFFRTSKAFPLPVFEPGTAEFHMVRRKKKYVELARSLKVVHPNYCLADGKRYDLPWKPDATPSIDTKEGVPSDLMEYFAVWLTYNAHLSICYSAKDTVRMCITSNVLYDRGNVLMKLAHAFGGVVRRSHSYSGMRRPCVQWYIGNEGAARMARCVLPFTSNSSKQEQFEIISRWSADRENRKMLLEEWRRLKAATNVWDMRVMTAIETRMQFACMVDCIGTMSVSGCKYPALWFSSYNRSAVEAVNEFLARQGLPTGGISAGYMGTSQNVRHQWHLSRAHDLVTILKYVRPLLMQKAYIADLIIHNDGQLSFETLQDLRAFNGNQGKAGAYDIEGMELFRGVQRLQWKYYSLRRTKKTTEDQLNAVKQEIRDMQMQKYKSRLRTETQQYKETARHLLDLGGTLSR